MIMPTITDFLRSIEWPTIAEGFWILGAVGAAWGFLVLMFII